MCNGSASGARHDDTNGVPAHAEHASAATLSKPAIRSPIGVSSSNSDAFEYFSWDRLPTAESTSGPRGALSLVEPKPSSGE
jgi:hypothetical protein